MEDANYMTNRNSYRKNMANMQNTNSMSNTENVARRCNCNMNCMTDMQSMNNSGMYNSNMYNINNNANSMNNNEYETREELLQEIKCYKFAIADIALYLDTHPEDQKALCLHREYCNKNKYLTDQYQKMYGPLSIEVPCNKWRWLEEPWPWERGGY